MDDRNDSNALNYNIPWGKDEPSGKGKKNSAYWSSYDEKLFAADGNNNHPKSVACNFVSRPYLILRGLCKYSQLDSLNIPRNIPNSPSINYPWNPPTHIDVVYDTLDFPCI